MELAEFSPIAGRIMEGGGIHVHFGDESLFSLPVAVRRDDTRYDALFLFQRPVGGQSPRPHAWMLLDAADNRVALFSRCDMMDFMSGADDPLDAQLPMELPELHHDRKRPVLQDRLLAAYEEIRVFAFEENLSRGQAAAVSVYKDLFPKLTYPSHYPYYYGLSPAFFHWLRMPLPKEGAQDRFQTMNGLQRDGYQLLILENLQQLVRQFQEKIAADAHKDKLFDDMHRELQEYKNGMIGSLTLSLERDIVQVIDNTQKSVEAFRQKSGGCDSCKRMLALLEGLETDLTDVLYRHGVEPYTVESLDVRRQKIVSTVATGDPALDKTVAARMARGWEKEGQVVRPERVAAYVYRPGEGTPKEDEDFE